MLVKTVWRRSARSWIVEKTKGTNTLRPNKSGGPFSCPPRTRPPRRLPSLTITVDLVHVQLRKFALASISAAAHAGSRANRRANNGDVCPPARKRKWKRYFEVDTRRRCPRVSFWRLFRSLRLLIARNRYRNPTIAGEIVWTDVAWFYGNCEIIIITFLMTRCLWSEL